MQIHRFAKQQTVLAFNGFLKGPNSDVGIGNNTTSAHADWTFSNSATQCEGGALMILVELENSTPTSSN
jgi:hypothetical protein